MRKAVCILCAALLAAQLAACGAPAESAAEVSSVPEASSAPEVSSVPEVSRAPEASSAPEVSSIPEGSGAEAAPAAEASSAPEAAPVSEAAEPAGSGEETDEEAEWLLDRAKREIKKVGYKVVDGGDDFNKTFLKVKVKAGDRMAGLREIIDKVTYRQMQFVPPTARDPITSREFEIEEAPRELQVTIKKSGSSYTIYYKYRK